MSCFKLSCGFFLMIFLSFTTSSFTQSKVTFDHLSLEDGLSQSTVNCILQDHNGFMWFGTDDGLNRYDGYQFKVHKQDELDPQSLSHNYIKSIVEDSTGKIWIGTISGGLNRFDPESETFTHFKYDPANGNSLSDDDVYSIFLDHSGMLWLGTIGGGLNQFDPKNETFRHFQHDPENPQSLIDDEVYSIYEDRSGVLWIGTQNGLDKFDPKSRTFIHYQHEPNHPKSLSNNSIRSIYEDRLGNLLIGTWGGGLNQFDRESETFTAYKNEAENEQSLSDNVIYSIYEDLSNRLWIGTSGGLNLFNRKQQNFERFQDNPEDPNSLSNNSVHCILEDGSGLLWFGTLNQINLLHSFKKGFNHYQYDANNPHSLGNFSVGSIFEGSSGAIWIGTSDGGFDKFDLEKETFVHFVHEPSNPKSLSNNRIRAVYEDRAGFVWVGTYGGLNRFDPKTGIFNHYLHDPGDPGSLSNNRVWAIHEDHLGTLWVGTYDGLDRFDPVSETFIHYQFKPDDPGSLSGNYARTIYEDRSGILWIGTQNGLNQYLRESDSFIHYQNDPDNPQSINGNHVNCIYQAQSGHYWIGTHKGLNRFDQKLNLFKSYREKDGLPNEVVYGILEDKKGNLWLSTNLGISKFNPQTETFKNYDIDDGLQGNEFNGGAYWEIKSGEMIFGGVNGLTIFHPDSIKNNPFIPPLVFTRFIRYNTRKVEIKPIEEKGISEKEEITLSYQDKILTIEFSALSYHKTSKNQYQYQLEGFADKWMDLGTEHKVTLTNLNPGNYTLKVKGSNNDGGWNPTPAQLKIRIIPPWWLTWWSYFLYALLFLGLLYLFYHFQLQRKLEQEEAKRLREIDQLKNRFFTNITHEFRTPLTVVSGMSDQIEEFLDKKAYGKIRETAAIIKRNSNKQLNLINQLLDLAKLESGKLKVNLVQGDVVSYLQFLTESFQSFADSKNIRLTFYKEIDQLVITYDAEKLLAIVSNLLANALKFTPENGKVILHVNVKKDKKAQSLLIKVKDTGIGIDESSLPFIFNRFYQVDGSSTRQEQGTGIGLALTKEYVELMGGKISVKSQRGKGTEFAVQLPAAAEKGIPMAIQEKTKSLKEKTNVFLPMAAQEPEIKAARFSSDQKPMVLIVEDNPDIVIYLTTCLEANYRLTIAKNGQEGIDKAIEEVPDIVISDVMMPVKDGYQVTETLKNDERTSHIPIILLTAKATQADKLSGLKRGADAYLTKPFDKTELSIRLQQLLQLRKKLQAHYRSFTPTPDPETQLENTFLQKIRQAVETHLSDPDFDNARLCREMGMSRSQVYRKLMALTDRSASQMIRSIRLHKAKEMLLNNDSTIAEVAYDVGFKDPSYFTRTFIEEFGTSPSATRNHL